MKVIPAESLPRWSCYAAMERDTIHDGPGAGDGVLTTTELHDLINDLDEKASILRAKNWDTDEVDDRKAEHLQLLSDMEQQGAQGLDYLPQQLRDADLPDNLVRRAVEMLMRDDDDQDGRITRDVVRRAVRRYSGMARSPGSSSGQAKVIREINQVAAALGV